MKKYLIALFISLFSNMFVILANSLDDQLENIEKYHSFWSTFEKRQQKLMQEKQEQYKDSWDRFYNNQQKKEFNFDAQKVEKLIDAANMYRAQLDKFKNSSNRPDVLINLAQILYLISDHLNQEKEELSKVYKEEALATIEKLVKDFPYFRKIDFALFLQANLYLSLGFNDQSINTWKKLSRRNGDTIYTAYALLSLGDYYFYNDKPQISLKYYEKSLKKIDTNNVHIMMVYYRLAWSYYRSGELDQVIEVSKKILTSNRDIGNFLEHKKLFRDVLELSGDAIYELSDHGEMEDKFNDFSEYGKYASELGLYLVNRFMPSKQFHKIIKLGEKLLEEFPLDKETPQLLYSLSEAYSNLSHADQSIATLEKLSLFLPANSLWRSKFQDDKIVIEKMEERAFQASIVVADWNFQLGMSSNYVKHFLSAASYYSIALSHKPYHEKSTEWTLARANCYYYAGQLQEAAIQYINLIEERKLDEDLLESAFYQLVRVYEKIWRKSFLEAIEKDFDVYNHEGTKQALKHVEHAVESYVQNFPDNTRSIDLLLVVATSNKDHGEFEQAIKFWNRVLTMDANVYQRKLSIRGIIFSYLKNNSLHNVIKVIRSFLETEDWSVLGQVFQSEILKILSQSILDESQNLSEKGLLIQAGDLLVENSKKYSDIPNRSQLLRNSAFFYAIAGDLNKAQDTASFYIKSGLKDHISDIYYLIGRTYEFRMKFDLAAKTYWTLYQKFPKYPKIFASLKRAENLASAENLHTLAGNISYVLSNYENKQINKLKYLSSSVEHFIDANNLEKAVDMAKKRLELSNNVSDKIQSSLILARAYSHGNNDTLALATVEDLLANEKEYKKDVGLEVWRVYTAKANLILVNVYIKKFDQIEIWKKINSDLKVFNEKNDLYEKLKYFSNNVIKTNHYESVTEVRYKLADVAEKFSVQILNLATHLSKQKQTVPDFLNQLSRELKKYSQSLFSQNIILGNKYVDMYSSNNIWVAKSYWRLSSSNDRDKEPFKNLVMPHAIHFDLPYQWSL